MSVVWDFFMPLLFALIGAEVNVEYMESRLIGKYQKHCKINKHMAALSREQNRTIIFIVMQKQS